MTDRRSELLEVNSKLDLRWFYWTARWIQRSNDCSRSAVTFCSFVSTGWQTHVSRGNVRDGSRSGHCCFELDVPLAVDI